VKPQNNYMPPEQFQQVLDTIPKLNLRKFSVDDVRMLFTITYWLGLRINETIKLKVEDFDMERMQVFLGKTKTAKADYVIIPTLFVPQLHTYLLGRQGRLFPTMSYITTFKWIEKLGKILNIPAWTVPEAISGEKTKTHIFRKSMAKDMMYGTHTNGRKAPINVISKQLRHKGNNAIMMTERYLRVDNETVKEWWNEPTTDQFM
jgi:integrase